MPYAKVTGARSLGGSGDAQGEGRPPAIGRGLPLGRPTCPFWVAGPDGSTACTHINVLAGGPRPHQPHAAGCGLSRIGQDNDQISPRDVRNMVASAAGNRVPGGGHHGQKRPRRKVVSPQMKVAWVVMLASMLMSGLLLAI